MRQLNPNEAFQEVMVKGHLNSFGDVPLEIEQEADEVDKSTTENHSIFPPKMQQVFLEAHNGNVQFEGSTSYQDQIQLLKKEILEKNQQISEMKGLLSEKDEEILELRSKLSNPTFQS
jgi:hypothetical protein